MKYAILDGSCIKDKESLHCVTKYALRFPDYYGKNLDALYDCLTDITEELTILVTDAASIEDVLGDYAGRFFRTIEDAAEERPNLHFRVYR